MQCLCAVYVGWCLRLSGAGWFIGLWGVLFDLFVVEVVDQKGWGVKGAGEAVVISYVVQAGFCGVGPAFLVQGFPIAFDAFLVDFLV